MYKVVNLYSKELGSVKAIFAISKVLLIIMTKETQIENKNVVINMKKFAKFNYPLMGP